jgi:hypothetical protein
MIKFILVAVAIIAAIALLLRGGKEEEFEPWV